MQHVPCSRQWSRPRVLCIVAIKLGRLRNGAPFGLAVVDDDKKPVELSLFSVLSLCLVTYIPRLAG